MNLKGQHIYLRALEPNDLGFLFEIENDTSVWELSGTQKPYSKAILEQYLANAHLDVYEVKQLRLCISDYSHNCIGLVDLFDFDPKNKRAGVGIIIKDKKHRNKGYGSEALAIFCDYAFSILDLHQVFATILEDNAQSRTIFEKLGFSAVGIKKDWVFSNGIFKNEILYQKFKH